MEPSPLKSSSSFNNVLMEDQTQIRIYSNDMEKMIREFQNSNPEYVIQFIYQELDKMNLNHTIMAIEEETNIKSMLFNVNSYIDNMKY